MLSKIGCPTVLRHWHCGMKLISIYGRLMSTQSFQHRKLLETIFAPDLISSTDAKKLADEVMNTSLESGRELIARLVNDRLVIETKRCDVILLSICDNLHIIDTPKDLQVLAEFAASKPDSLDFSVLGKVVGRASNLLTHFSSTQFVGLLTLLSRVDFVDSDFSQAVQEYLPNALPTFGDNQFPPIFCSILRLGIDQHIDRVPVPVGDESASACQQSLPFMVCLVNEMIKRVPNISESGCLAILHSIVRRPRAKITKEMDELVVAISQMSNISNWGLAMRIQAIHTLSRLGIHDQSMIESLLNSVDKQSCRRIPSGNLQHLLSIIHNHADKHSELVWRPVIDVCIARMQEAAVSRSMPMSTIAVTLGYLGRLGVVDMRVIEGLLCSFAGTKNTPQINYSIMDKLSSRILTDNQTDISHLSSILEALEKLGAWKLPLAIPLAMITRRLILRDGIHNIKAAPIALTTNVFIANDFPFTDSEVSEIDELIDASINTVVSESRLSPNWSLKSTTELVKTDKASWRQRTILTFLEGLLKHEQYIRSTPSAIQRCLGLRNSILTDPARVGLQWTDVGPSARAFIDSLDQ